MKDSVLLSRLQALVNSLEMVVRNLEDEPWRPTEDTDARIELVEQALWDGMKATINLSIRRRVDDLNQLIKQLQHPTAGDEQPPRVTWTRYNDLLRDSQSLLRECLEIIGTLAIRNKDLDQKILYLADELVRDCLNVAMASRDYYLTVHGLGDTTPARRARIIRIRFPEWTIWDLPLIAHELGHVAITLKLGTERLQQDDELSDLTPFLAEQQQLLLALDPKLKEMMQGDAQPETPQQKLAKEWARSRVNILVADAFATFTMGPAYACSAITLRFNPCTEASQDTPSDAQRALVVMSTLGWMDSYLCDQMKTGKHNPYKDVIDRLNDAWANAMAQSETACTISAGEQQYLRNLAHVFARDVCRRIFMTSAMYPLDAWQRAEGWSAGWLDQQEHGRPLTWSLNPSGKLRDVLNAAWLCRLRTTDFSQIEGALAEVGKSLCAALIPRPVMRAAIPSNTTATR